MERYRWIELADMHLVYSATFTSGPATQRLYRDRYPNSRIPHHTTFSNIHGRLCQSGTVHRWVNVQGRGRFVPTLEAGEAVLQYVENNPSVSTRDIARYFHMSHVIVWRFCRKCCCVRTTLREFMLLHQLTIHPEFTSVTDI